VRRASLADSRTASRVEEEGVRRLEAGFDHAALGNTGGVAQFDGQRLLLSRPRIGIGGAPRFSMTSIPVFKRTEPGGLKPAGSTPMRSGIVLPAAFPDTMWLVDGIRDRS